MALTWEIASKELEDVVPDRDSSDIELVKKKFGDVEGMAKAIKTSLTKGLSESDEPDFADRKAHFGTNILPKNKARPLWSFWWEALKDMTLRILIVAAVISICLGVALPPPGESRSTAWIEGFAILIAVAVVSTVTALNDWSKDKKFNKLSNLTEERKMNVLRDGKISQLPTDEIVVGDVVCLSTGDYIPADLYYISGTGISVDESSMTGEPESKRKSPERPYFLSGCMVTEGFAHGLVIATGVNSRWGKLKASLVKEEHKTPLQSHLETLAENIGKLGIVMAVFTLLALIIRWIVVDYVIDKTKWEWDQLGSLLRFVITAITVVVVAVPEGLPLAVTLSLAFSMLKMMKDNNLVRHLVACETMGGATNICSDKTGTLTQNRMTVVKLWLGGEMHEEIPDKKPKLKKRLMKHFTQGIAVNSTAHIETLEDGRKDFIGAKTECALLVLSGKFGADYQAERKDAEYVRVFPFSSKKKRSSAVIKEKGGHVAYCKGASEVVLESCVDKVDTQGEKSPITEEDRKTLGSVIDVWAGQGLRTLTLAYRELPEEIELPADDSPDTPFDSELTLLAIVGIEDPLREEVPQSVRECQGAGITVRMVTGDNLLTAKSISKRCGILTDDGVAIEGPEFRKLTIPEIDELIPRLQVIARCSPEDKLVLVKRLRELGEVVAVTGDGTNDAPALREADVGFAMGISGTEVAKGACDIILLDDNFSSIEKAVMWGRNVYDAIRKFLQFQLTVNVVAVVVAFVGAISEGESPITPVQLLWVNLIMDTMAALALATEPPTRALLNRPPHGRNAPLITFRMWRTILSQSLFQLAVCFFILWGGQDIEFFNIRGGPEHQLSCLVFNTFVFCQVFNEINCRKLGDEKNVFEGMHRNYIFIAVILITIVLQALMVEFGGDFMQTVGLDWKQWLFCIGVGLLSLPLGFIVRFLPVPDDKYLESKKKKSNTVELDDIKVTDEEEGEESEEDETDQIKPKSKRQSQLINEDRRPRSASQNWKIAQQAMVKVSVISAFRRPIHGVEYDTD